MLDDINSPDKWYQKALSVLDEKDKLYKEIKKSLDNYNSNSYKDRSTSSTNRYGNKRKISYHKPYTRNSERKVNGISKH